MQILDVIKNSAEILGLENEVEILKTATMENETTILQNPEIAKLFSLFGLSMQEFCTAYASVSVCVEATTTDKKIALADLENYVKVLAVYQGENKVDYKIIGHQIVVEQDGTYVVKYTTYPNITSLFEEVDFLSNLSPDVMVMGLCSYYAIARGRFDEYKIYHETYREKAESIKEMKIFELPMRRWE